MIFTGKRLRLVIYAFLISLILTAGAAEALAIKGADFADKVTVSGKKLLLNGAGIKKKFFFSIYACAFYLPQPTTDPVKAVSDDVCKQVIMHCLHSKIKSEKIIKGWNDGFFNNSQEKMNELSQRIATFNSFFNQDMLENERITLSYTPGQGTSVTIKKKLRGTIPGKDFMQALLAIWLGNNPVDNDLKNDMLGK